MTDPFVAPIRRDIVTATGPDTIAFLQGQMSQDIGALSIRGVALSFLLQPQGKVDAWMRVHRSGNDEVRMDVDAGSGDAVVARLERFKLRTRCDVDLEAGVSGVAIRHTTVAQGLPCGWPGVEGVDVLGADVEHIGDFGLDPDILRYDEEAFDAERICAGVPRMGAEITPDTIPAELGDWLVQASVSFTKGCFTGQELVARIDSRGGNVPRHLRVFHTEDLPPPVGTAIMVGDKAVGAVTSAAVGAWGDTVGLAFVHRSMVPPFAADAAGTPISFSTQ